MTATVWLGGMAGVMALAALREWWLFVRMPASVRPREPLELAIRRMEHAEAQPTLLGRSVKVDLWIRLGLLHAENGRPDLGLSYLERAVHHLPDGVDGVTRSNLWRMVADLRERDLCDGDVVFAGWDAAARSLDGAPKTSRTLHSMAELLRALGHWAEASAILESLAERLPKERPALRLAAAGTAYDAGDFARTEALARATLADGPESLHPTAWLLIGASCGARGDNAGARAAYAQGTDAPVLLALCDLREGQPEAALAQLDAATEIRDARTAALVRAEALAELGRFHEALACLLAIRSVLPVTESAVEVRRSEAVVSLLMALIELRAGERPSARRHLNAARVALDDHPRLSHWCHAVHAALTQSPDDLAAAKARLETIPHDQETRVFCLRVLDQIGE